MTSHNIDKIMNRIFENTDTIPTPGIIIASPSNEPDYKYHWIRDSALVMRPIIDMYSKTKESKYFHYIINYIENEFIENIIKNHINILPKYFAIQNRKYYF